MIRTRRSFEHQRYSATTVSDLSITMSERMIRPAPPARTRFGRWWLDLPLSKKGVLLILVPLAVTIVVLISAFALQQDAARTRRALLDATNTLVQTSVLTEEVGEAEGAVRGYVATGDATMLGPYESAAERLPELTARLVDEAPDRYAAQVQDVGQEATRAIDALGAAADRAAPAEGDPAAAAEALAPATVAVDVFRADSSVVRGAIYSNIATDVDDSLRLQDDTQRVLVVGLLLVIATSVGGGAIIARSIIGRTVRLSENVKRYSAGEPMLPAPAAGDEIGQLADALESVGNMLARQQGELTASRDSALAATRAKDEFLSRTSHELRTPLSAIIGFGQLLQMEDLSDDDRESVDHIVRAGRHLLSLINEVLDIAKIETGVVSLSVEPVQLADVVDEAVALVGGQVEEREITVSVAVPPDLVVHADRQRLEQIVLNLLTNAVKYNTHGGRVDVAAAVVAPVANEVTDGGAPTAPSPHDADRVRLSVTDTGPGIAGDEIARLFEPFERLDAAARGIDGTGVGLALSKALTEAMGGEIGVQSTVGEGSTFWCDFDRADAAATPAAPTTERPGTDDRPPAKDGSIVLYVEDNVANQHLVSRVLRDRPEHLEVVAEGRRALDFARRVRPAAVLLDLHLPDMHGYDVLTRLKADPATADIPVVIVSADATGHTREQLSRAGAFRYLTKPVDVGELRDVLDRLAREKARPAVTGSRSSI